MKIIDTSITQPKDLDHMEAEWVYNGMDCAVTLEVLNAILPQLDEHTSATYDFSRALQGPVLEMRLRGCLVDQERKARVLDQCFDKLEVLESNLERLALEGVGMPHFNWRSGADKQELFYNRLKIPAIKKQGRLTVDRNALEKLENYLIARPFVRHLIAMGEIGKQISFLQTGIDPDGRIRTSYNIAGTSTGRFSSSFSEFGTGTNLQNIEDALRSILVPDPGYKFAKFDGAQIQSRLVGALEWSLFQDPTYLDACEGGDLHTAVAKMCWPKLPWTGDLSKDVEIAETPFYRHYTYRFMCKKIGHGTNFDGQPPTISTQAKIPILVISEFQPRYFRAFPSHKEWHRWTDNKLRRDGYIVSLTGRKRHFWGRRGDPQTVRDALAYSPQADEAFIVNTALLKIWQSGIAIVMFQDHDAITVMYPEDREDEIVPQVQELLKVPVDIGHGRTLLIPFDCKTGWNKGDYNEQTNPDGLKKWKPGDKRKRSEKVHILDRVG